MRHISFAGVLTASALLAGCVGKIQTLPNREFTPPGAALRGISYALPKVRYEVKLTRALAECPVGDVDGKPTALKFSVSAVATPTMVAGESYSVDYEKLPGWLRTSSFEIKHYPNGTLKSIGAGAEDKTAEVIDSVAKTAFSIATIVGLSSGEVAASAVAPTGIVKCTPQAEAAVAEAHRIDSDLKKVAERLTRYEKEDERLRAAGTARLIDQAGRQRFLALFDDIRTAEDDIERLKKRRAELAEQLGVTDEIIWNGGVTAPGYDRAYPLSPAQRNKLAKLLATGRPPAGYPTDAAEAKRQSLMKDCYGDSPAVDNCLNEQLTLRSGLYLERELEKCGADGADPVECRREVAATDRQYQAARDEVPDKGIFVREPMIGRLLFCREALLSAAAATTAAPPARTAPAHGEGSAPPTQPPAHPTAGATGTHGGTLEGGTPGQSGTSGAAAPGNQTSAATARECTTAADETNIAAADFPQFGQLRFFPLSVRTFQAREMALSLTDSGRIESFSYKSTKAPAQALASTAADVAGQSESFLAKREAARRDDRKTAREEEIAAIQQQITVLTKQAELKKLQTPPDVDPLKPVRDETAAVEAELALAKAKLGRLKTEAELAALQ
jgi:hypothetical protein